GRVTIAADLGLGERLTMVKFLSYGWSSQRSLPAIRDQVIAAVAKAKHAGWQNLLKAQRAYLDDFWTCADAELAGDPERQQGARSATTTRRAAFASTASRAPTSTAPSPTTTSSPTCSRSGTCSQPPTASPVTRRQRPSSAPTSRRPRPGATPPTPWSCPGTRRS